MTISPEKNLLLLESRKADLPNYPVTRENPLGSCHQGGTFSSILLTILELKIQVMQSNDRQPISIGFELFPTSRPSPS